MGRAINKITIKGYKSIASLDEFELGAINVLIGANGSGKSNFISFFHLLREMVESRLEKTVNKLGGSDLLLHLGPKVTEKVEAKLEFGMNGYSFALEPTADSRLIFGDERIEYQADPGMRTTSVDRSIGVGHGESKLKEHSEKGFNNQIAKHVYESVSSWTVYHYNDTSETAAMRRRCSMRDNERLRPDAGNLAAFLYRLKKSEKDIYSLICSTIRLVAPYFKDFKLRPKKGLKDRSIELEWEQEESDYPFHASQLSDGTLRFIALATTLLQPEPPTTILIDEPELGLHPYALEVLSALLKQANSRTQVVVATQSPQLLSSFDVEDIIVVERENGETSFKRLAQKKLSVWLENYSLGDVWQKNIFGGGPSNE